VVPPPGDASALTALRQEFMREAGPIGTVPPPASLKGAAKTALKALQGEKATVFVDKLAERLAFERGGTRLYQLLVGKADVYNTWDGGPTREQLVEILRDELNHMNLVRDALLELGADPTAMTPSAD